jgi:hypothetical protein
MIDIKGMRRHFIKVIQVTLILHTSIVRDPKGDRLFPIKFRKRDPTVLGLIIELESIESLKRDGMNIKSSHIGQCLGTSRYWHTATTDPCSN